MIGCVEEPPHSDKSRELRCTVIPKFQLLKINREKYSHDYCGCYRKSIKLSSVRIKDNYEKFI